MKMPSVSIIVPVYKIEETLLRRCIESLMAQTLEDIEILLVDDGCPAGCGDICDDYSQQDSRIQVIHQANRGLSAARNTGMDAARGKYIAFVDGDDFVEPDFCRVMYTAAEANGADVTVCGADYYRPDTDTFTPFFSGQTTVYREPEEIRQLMLTLLRTVRFHRNEAYFPLNHFVWAHLYRANCVRGCRFDEQFTRGEDKVFNFFVFGHCRVFCSVSAVLCHYVINPSSLSNSFKADALALALFTYRFYRTLPLVANDPEFLGAHYIRTCSMVLNQATRYFLHPDNPDKNFTAGFRRFCREDVVAEAIQKADIREMRPCKLKLCILCLKLGLYGPALKLAKRFGL